MGLIGSDLTCHPELTRWVATQTEDAELTALAETYRSLSDRLHEQRRRGDDGRRRIEAIDLALVDASAKESDRFLRERATLDAELESLPRQLAVLTERVAQARLSWLARLRVVALGEVGQVTEALATPLSEGQAIRTEFLRDESGLRPADKRTPAEQAAAMRRRLDELAAETRPLVGRAEWARQIVAIIDLFAEQYHGRTVVLDNPNTWPVAA